MEHVTLETSPPAAPPHPHYRIEPRSGWRALNFAELWQYRDLFTILCMRDIRLRYKQTALGIVWVILQPLLTSLVSAIIFGFLAHLPSEGAPYMLFVFAGMLVWNLLAQSLQRGGISLVASSQLVSKVYFPRMLIPVAATGAVMVDVGVSLVVLVPLMFYFHVTPSLQLLTLPLFLLLALTLAVGLTLWITALNVFYRDFTYALPFVVQLWMNASPIVYSDHLLPLHWRLIYALNPMVGCIDGFRWALLHTTTFPTTEVSMSVVLAIVAVISGMLVFRRVEKTFADVI